MFPYTSAIAVFYPFCFATFQLVLKEKGSAQISEIRNLFIYSWCATEQTGFLRGI